MGEIWVTLGSFHLGHRLGRWIRSIKCFYIFTRYSLPINGDHKLSRYLVQVSLEVVQIARHRTLHCPMEMMIQRSNDGERQRRRTRRKWGRRGKKGEMEGERSPNSNSEAKSSDPGGNIKIWWREKESRTSMKMLQGMMDRTTVKTIYMSRPNQCSNSPSFPSNWNSFDVLLRRLLEIRAVSAT